MQFKLKMQFLVYDNDQVTTFGDTMMIEDSSIVMILKSGLHTMMKKDKKIGDIIIMPHPDTPPPSARIIRARKGSNIRSSGVLSIMMLNLQDTKARFNDDQDTSTMLEDTKRVDTLSD